jgi:hypothetical protein
MFVNGAIAIRRPTTDASYQVTVHLAEQFRGVDFLKIFFLICFVNIR